MSQEMNEGALRLGAFFCTLGVVIILETLFPRRKRLFSRFQRWKTNLSIVMIGSVLTRLGTPITLVALAEALSTRNAGLLGVFELPPLTEAIIGIVLLDLVVYLQHVMFHAVPLLWRLHLVHHADPDFDTTTGLRFHPLEILISYVIKAAAIAAIGPSGATVLAFEVILNTCALFNHGNLKLPLWLDRPLRLLVVTPDTHRVHHSTLASEMNSNFGFNIPLWDRLFGTYRSDPEKGQEGFSIGLETFQSSKKPTELGWALAVPFVATNAGANST